MLAKRSSEARSQNNRLSCRDDSSCCQADSTQGLDLTARIEDRPQVPAKRRRGPALPLGILNPMRILALLLSFALLAQAELRRGVAEKAGFQAEKLTAACRLVEQEVTSGAVGAAALLVARNGIVAVEHPRSALNGRDPCGWSSRRRTAGPRKNRVALRYGPVSVIQMTLRLEF